MSHLRAILNPESSRNQAAQLTVNTLPLDQRSSSADDVSPTSSDEIDELDDESGEEEYDEEDELPLINPLDEQPLPQPLERVLEQPEESKDDLHIPKEDEKPFKPASAPPAPAPRRRLEKHDRKIDLGLHDHKAHADCPDTLACLPDTNGRPQHTLPVILRCAILGSPRKRLTIREIYAAMETKYPYYKTAGQTWKQSVRHHLSLNRLFERQPRPVTDPGFGSYWTVNLDAPPGTKRPRKRGRANKDVGEGSSSKRSTVKVQPQIQMQSHPQPHHALPTPTKFQFQPQSHPPPPPPPLPQPQVSSLSSPHSSMQQHQLRVQQQPVPLHHSPAHSPPPREQSMSRPQPQPRTDPYNKPQQDSPTQRPQQARSQQQSPPQQQPQPIHQSGRPQQQAQLIQQPQPMHQHPPNQRPPPQNQALPPFQAPPHRYSSQRANEIQPQSQLPPQYQHRKPTTPITPASGMESAFPPSSKDDETEDLGPFPPEDNNGPTVSEDEYESEEEMREYSRGGPSQGLAAFNPMRPSTFFTLPPFSALDPPREDKEVIEHMRVEIASLRRTSAEAVSTSIRLSEQLANANLEVSRSRDAVRDLEDMLQSEASKRSEAERSKEIEVERRRAAEQVLSGAPSRSSTTTRPRPT
ncbi:hypothetical protein B0H34DRAFT_792076 [Crassisporium funariophilum]|nr:hypothetical protein B0H34DRAFT_792076 [Crassisporium funariophilum]